MGLIDKVNVEVNGSGDVLSTLSTYTTKILKPNIVDGRNVLTQQMVSAKNTKYVIKYDFELEENITVPANCVLEFEGGSFANASGNSYTLTGNKTGIAGSLRYMFLANVTLNGSFEYDYPQIDSIEELLASDFPVGIMYKTKSYYKNTACGGAVYKIVDESAYSELSHQGLLHSLTNGNYAELVIENGIVNATQLGALPFSEDIDCGEILKSIESYTNHTGLSVELVFPNGVFYFNPVVLTTRVGFKIQGTYAVNNSRIIDGDWVGGTIFAPVKNQNHIIQFGNGDDARCSVYLNNVCFTTSHFEYNEEIGFYVPIPDSFYEVSTAMKLYGCVHSNFDNIFFHNIYKGSAINIKNSWENYFGYISMRYLTNTSEGGIVIESGLINNTSIERLSVESISSDIIVAKASSKIHGFYIGSYELEPQGAYYYNGSYITRTLYNDLPSERTIIEHSLFSIGASSLFDCRVNCIMLNNIGLNFYNYNGAYHTHSVVYSIEGNMTGMDNGFLVSVGCISVTGHTLPVTVVSTPDEFAATISKFSLDCYNDNAIRGANPIFKVQNFYRINLNDNLRNKITHGYEYPNSESPLNYIYDVSSNNGSIYGDGDFLVVKLKKLENASNLRLFGIAQNCSMLAKIPNGQTLTLLVIISGTKTSTISLTGTGDYKWYKLWENGAFLADNAEPITNTELVQLIPSNDVTCFVKMFNFEQVNYRKYGGTNQLPTMASYNKGHQYYVMQPLNGENIKKPVFWNGSNWVDAFGFHVANRYGNARPTTLNETDAGFCYYDAHITPARPIWWTGSGWVDATGATV